MTQTTINDTVLAETISFEEYLQLTQDILDEKIPRAGIYLNDNTFRYTRSNLQRMQKVLQEMTLSRKIYNLLEQSGEDWIWLVISEPWCGDASWGVPALYTISMSTPKIDFRILLRDTHPDVMKNYQTAGSDSIPKLICLRKADLKELGTWGPRPAELHQMVLEFRKEQNFDYRESVRRLHSWFETDMTRSTQEEMIDHIKRWKVEGNG